MNRHFSEVEIVDLVWINAADQYWNALSIPLEFDPSSWRRSLIVGADTESIN